MVLAPDVTAPNKRLTDALNNAMREVAINGVSGEFLSVNDGGLFDITRQVAGKFIALVNQQPTYKFNNKCSKSSSKKQKKD
jgi:hypothetical protein